MASECREKISTSACSIFRAPSKVRSCCSAGSSAKRKLSIGTVWKKASRAVSPLMNVSCGERKKKSRISSAVSSDIERAGPFDHDSDPELAGARRRAHGEGKRKQFGENTSGRHCSER